MIKKHNVKTSSVKKIALFLAFYLCSTHFLYANKLPIDRYLINGTLSNGFKYTIRKNSKPAKSASLRLIVKAGSLDEDDDQKGIAHLVEHLAFNGTEHFPGNSIIKFLESMGIEFGHNLNASTSATRTLFQLDIPLLYDNLEKSMIIFGDWARRVVFTQKELEKEKGVVLEEARVTNDVGFRLYLQSKDTIYANSKYKDRTPIGDLDIVKNIKLDRVKAFYDDWYRPEFMHFVVVGDINVSKMEDLIKRTFGEFKNKSKRQRASRSVPNVDKYRLLILKDKELSSSSINIKFTGNYTPLITENDYKNMMLRSIAIGLFNKKASEQIIKNNPAAKSIVATTGRLGDNLKTYSFNASYVGVKELDALRDLTQLIYSIEKFGFDKKEFERTIKDTLRNNTKRKKTLKNRSNSTLTHMITGHAINESIYVDEEYSLDLEEKILKTITLHEVNETYRDILKLKNIIITYKIADNTEVSKRRIKNIFLNARKNVKEEKQDSKLPNKIQIPALKPASIIKKEYNEKFDYTKYTLSNGVKFVYKYNNYDKDIVLLTSFSKGGYSLYDTKDLTNAKFTSSIISSSGLDQYNIIEVSKIYSDKIVSLDAFIKRYSENIAGSSISDDFKYLLEKIYLIATKYRFDENIFLNTKTITLANLKKENRSPKRRFRREFLEFYFQNNKRYTNITKEDINRLNKDKIIEIYKDRFSDLNNFMFFIVGDISKEKVEKYAKLYLGNLPTKNRDETYKFRGTKYLKGKHEFIRFYNNENISNITLSYAKELPYDEEKSIHLSALGSILNVKLREYIREQKSGVYTISVKTSMTREPYPYSLVTINFSCDPNRKREITKYIDEAIKDFLNNDVDQSYIQSYVKNRLLALDKNIKKASFWLNMLKISFRHNESLEKIEKVKNMIKNLNATQIKDAANIFFNTQDIMYTELSPKVKQAK